MATKTSMAFQTLLFSSQSVPTMTQRPDSSGPTGHSFVQPGPKALVFDHTADSSPNGASVPFVSRIDEASGQWKPTRQTS